MAVQLICNFDLSGIWWMESGQNFYKSRFTGSVLANQPVDCPLSNLQVSAIQGASAAKGLDDVAHRQRELFFNHRLHRLNGFEEKGFSRTDRTPTPSPARGFHATF